VISWESSEIFMLPSDLTSILLSLAGGSIEGMTLNTFRLQYFIIQVVSRVVLWISASWRRSLVGVDHHRSKSSSFNLLVTMTTSIRLLVAWLIKRCTFSLSFMPPSINVYLLFSHYLGMRLANLICFLCLPRLHKR